MRVNEKMTAIADAIRDKTGRTEKLGLDAIAEGVSEVYEAGIKQGKQSEYDRFWDAVQENGTRTDYDFTFAGEAWTAETFKPKYSIAPTTCFNAFAYWGMYYTDTKSKIDMRKFSLDFSKSTALNNLFFCNKLVSAVGVIDATSATNISGIFSNATNLHTVEKFIVRGDSLFTNAFEICSALQSITFEGVIGNKISFAQSYLLTTESVQSIIDHLKDLTGSTAQTLTFHAQVGASLTDVQKAAITAKNWTLVY